MSLQIPTITELNNAIIAQFESIYGNAVPVFAQAFLRVVAKVLAGLLVITYKFGGSIFLQQFVKFAGTTEVTINGQRLIPLVEWGRLVGLGPPTAATRAEMIISSRVFATGTLAANTQYTNRDNGFIYLTTVDNSLSPPGGLFNIRAYRDPDGNGGVGADGNLQVGDRVFLVTPDSRLSTEATVNSVVTTAANAESWDAYRNRVQDRFRKQPQGGAYADYESWAESVEGIINAYPYTGDPSEVNVYCEATPASSGSDDGIPTSAQLTAVEDAIEQDDTGLASRRPITAYVRALAITRPSFNYDILGLQAGTGVDLAPIKTAIDDALDAYCRDREPYISGLTVGPRKDRVTLAESSGAAQDVASAYGAIFTDMNMYDPNGTVVSIYALGEGEKAKAGTITYIG